MSSSSQAHELKKSLYAVQIHRCSLNWNEVQTLYSFNQCFKTLSKANSRQEHPINSHNGSKTKALQSTRCITSIYKTEQQPECKLTQRYKEVTWNGCTCLKDKKQKK